MFPERLFVMESNNRVLQNVYNYEVDYSKVTAVHKKKRVPTIHTQIHSLINVPPSTHTHLSSP